MSKISLLLGIAATLSACGSGEEAPPVASRPVVFVTIEPLKYFVDRMAGSLLDVRVLVGPGQSPATYEPTARQLTGLAAAKMLFAIGVPMERSLLPRIRRSFDGLSIVETQAGLHGRPVGTESPGSRTAGESGAVHDHSGGDLDPHVWLDPELARGIVRNIRNALAAAWPEYEETFAQKFMELDGELTRLRIEMEQTLGPVRGREMVVFHPAYGYF
ncbi:MAG: zinc ABC transporter substrate-binding protein, partial [Candidatus Latescibacterota bacterium]